MADYTLAAHVPTLDVGQSILTGQRIAANNQSMLTSQQEMQSRGLDIQSKTIDLGEKQAEVSALQNYRAAGGGDSAKALDALKNYPDQVLKIRQDFAAMSKIDQDKAVSHLGMLGEAARTVAALPDGSPEQKAEWSARLDHLHANGVITDNQWKAYKQSGPSALILNQVMQLSDQGHAALGLTQGGAALGVDTSGMSPADASRASGYASIIADKGATAQERDFAVKQLDGLTGNKKPVTLQQNIDIERLVNSEANARKITDPAQLQDLRASVTARVKSGMGDSQLLAGAAAGTQNPNWKYAEDPKAAGPGEVWTPAGAPPSQSALTGGINPAADHGNFDSMFGGNDVVAPRAAPPAPITAASAPPQSALTAAAPNRFDSMFGGNNVTTLTDARPTAAPVDAPATKTRGIAPPADQARYDRDFARAARPTTREQAQALPSGAPFINPADGKLHYRK